MKKHQCYQEFKHNERYLDTRGYPDIQYIRPQPECEGWKQVGNWVNVMLWRRRKHFLVWCYICITQYTLMIGSCCLWLRKDNCLWHLQCAPVHTWAVTAGWWCKEFLSQIFKMCLQGHHLVQNTKYNVNHFPTECDRQHIMMKDPLGCFWWTAFQIAAGGGI